MLNYINLGKKIYDINNPREMRRMAVFVVRAILHNNGMQDLERFFHSTPVLKKFIEENQFPLEQATRGFFFKNSNFKERAKIIKEHFDFMQHSFHEENLIKINSCKHILNFEESSWAGDFGYILWEHDFGKEIGTLRAIAVMEAGQRKEGLSSIELNLLKDGMKPVHLYQIMYWIAKDKNDRYSLYIGAMQGPNMAESKDIIKVMTKACHGYRTKNLAVYITQAFVRAIGIEKIYAITNDGYYANNHARRDRKLKTSFSDFWAEIGGSPTDDSRFYELPLTENRKTMEEVPTRKRAVYRRRFTLLDEVDETIKDKVTRIKVNC